MYRTILGLSLLATSAMAFAEGANGVWRTEANDSGYQNLGKPIIHDMKPHGENEYAGGTFWDPEKDKTYKS